VECGVKNNLDQAFLIFNSALRARRPELICAWLIIVALTSGFLSAAAEEDESDFFIPPGKVPADALHPQNVRTSFQTLISLPDVLLDDEAKAARQKTADSLRFGTSKPLASDDSKDIDRTRHFRDQSIPIGQRKTAWIQVQVIC
jgi:hypothetical protein